MKGTGTWLKVSPKEPANAPRKSASHMTRILIACAMLAVAVTQSGAAVAAEASPGRGPGWTGITNPKDVITARQELMEHIEILMEPIDTLQVRDGGDPDRLHAAAETISAMLLALPHLFPPTTNLYDPKVEMPRTLALPSIWKEFGAFYRLAALASGAAEEMAMANGRDQLRAASLRLRASCDACHAVYLRKYEPPKTRESDYQFNFDSALRRN
jgi:cytochrome c556